MTEILKIPFKRSYWVVPGKLLAGGYPGSENPIEEKRNLTGLTQAGIRHVISLPEPEEYGHRDDPFPPYGGMGDIPRNYSLQNTISVSNS